MRDSIIRELQDRACVDVFKTAESHRRWNIFNHAPWDELDLSKAGEANPVAVEHTWAEEMYLPDYSSNVTALFRQDFGAAWFETAGPLRSSNTTS